MATTDQNLNLELKHLEAFYKHIAHEVKCKETFFSLAKSGYLQISTIFEQAIANVNKTICVESAHGRDFSDGSDAKLSSVRTCSYGKRYSAPVCSVHAKRGLLRVQVYERKQDKFYYFVIPHERYGHIAPTSNIEIPFELDGTPRRVNKCVYNYWDNQVESFEAMATAK